MRRQYLAAANKRGGKVGLGKGAQNKRRPIKGMSWGDSKRRAMKAR